MVKYTPFGATVAQSV